MLNDKEVLHAFITLDFTLSGSVKGSYAKESHHHRFRVPH